jgi:hypothetical protein
MVSLVMIFNPSSRPRGPARVEVARIGVNSIIILAGATVLWAVNPILVNFKSFNMLLFSL